ncbi:MAG: 8-amino-7-oxononanoate synthase [Candidatus Omnitrophota bacterium]
MERVNEFLLKRKKENLYRRLQPAALREGGKIFFCGRQYFDFSSNDYLGLAQHPALKEASRRAAEKFGTGASASRLLSGDLEIHHELEEKVACFKGKEAALIFNSGYQANLGIISALYKKGDVVFSDRLNHASIIDGIRLSGAKLFRFPHNGTGYLESLLKKQRGNFNEALIITETIFSMDGDEAALKELADLKEKYNCRIMVDEAHATGIFGENGSGMVEEKGLTDRTDLIMGTFSKALGSFGAYIACSKQIKEYLVNACRSFIYSTSLPASVIAANLASLEVIKNEPARRNKLLDNARYFRGNLKRNKFGFTLRGSSQIVPVIIGGIARTIKLSQGLQNKGYWVLPIRPPTVPAGEARLRFSLTYFHTTDILERLINDINQIG